VDNNILELIEYLDELTSDSNIPRSVKAKFKELAIELKSMSDADRSLKVNKFLAELDDISSDSNLDAFTRQQIWSISSMLEGISQ
jgi:uncharacterized protein (UPF0147 family)